MTLLLARTHYSLLTGPASAETLAEAAVRAGHDHLALVDGNSLCGLWPFAQQAARLSLRPVFGCELVHGDRRVFALARDAEGYASLCQLLSERNLDLDFDLPRAAARLAAGLWFLCRDLALLPQLAVRVPRDQLLVPIGPHGHAAPNGHAGPIDAVSPDPTALARGRKAPDPGPQPARSALLFAARELDLEVCAVRDVWFADEADHTEHLLFLAVKWNRTLRQQDGDGLPGLCTARPWMHVPPRGAASSGHDDLPAAIAVAERVLASCTLSFPAQAAPIFPSYQVPEAYRVHGSGSEIAYLRALATAGLQQRLAGRSADEDATSAAHARLARELLVIEQMGFAPYFLVVHEIAELAAERGIPCLGRGSAADSLVAYALGLTEADPLRYGLLFERFLNPGRRDLPDIDLDFCWRRRDELLAAVFAHFGQERVAMIATYNTCGPRAAYGEAAKAMGVAPAEAARRSKLLPWHARPETSMAAMVADSKGFYRERVLPPERERQIVAAAESLLHAPRHLGVHPGGIVVTPGPVARYAPLERAPKGVVVTQYDKRFVEALGLVKIDLLGNRALTIVADCERSLAQLGIAVPSAVGVAEDDAETVALLQQGRTLGCFQVESPAMRTLLRQLQAPDMDRVIQAIALVRPGPAAAGMKDAFLRRARGEEAVTAAHPLLAEVFADTLGVMLYQEDVIRAAMAVAGLDAEQGDMLRRRLCNKGGGSGSELESFVVAGLRRGLPRAAVERIWAEMARFSAYSFCKAHAVTYGRLAYRCVYLKAHWPVAFLCAVLDNEAGYFDTGVYVEECKRLGGRMLPPCVQHGDDRFALVFADTIRVGWSQVRGMTQGTRQQIAAARRAGGPFRSFDDFLRRVEPQRDEAENLIRVGACDVFGLPRRELLWRLQVAASPRARAELLATHEGGDATVARRSGALWPDVLAAAPVAYPSLPEFDVAERTRHELALLGYALMAHPVDVLWQDRDGLRQDLVPCGRVDECVGDTICIRGWLVAWRAHRTEHGESMAFATIEDGSGLVEATMFPKVYAQCGATFDGRGPYVVRGVVEERLGGTGLRVIAVTRSKGA